MSVSASGVMYEKKQWYRKLPSRMKWHSASARCQMKRKRSVPDVDVGRTDLEVR